MLKLYFLHRRSYIAFFLYFIVFHNKSFRFKVFPRQGEGFVYLTSFFFP